MSFATRPFAAVAGAIIAALAAGASGAASPAMAAPSSASTGPVSVKPAGGTPALALTKTMQEIRQIAQCGGTMYAVGNFSTITQNGTTYTRHELFSFSATAPYTLSALAPNVNGQVNSIAFVNQNCADAYIGGTFTSVNGASATNIAEISTSTGALVAGFGHNANAEVDTLAGYNGHLLAGGHFTQINGISQNYFVSLNPSTGHSDGFVNLHITGHVTGMAAQVYKQEISHSGTLDLVEGNFKSVGGKPRQQIFMLNLAGSTAQVTAWTSPEFSQHCKSTEAFYVRSAAWSPDDQTVYVADTGYRPLGWVSGTYPLTGLCDAAAAFSASQTSVSHEWVEYTGCDSYYSVAADDGAVYVAGHPRWAENAYGCNKAGAGAIADKGLQGLNPGTGALLKNSSGQPEYSMSRANADDMLITSAGLWIASSNRFGSNWCDGYANHSGICFLQYT